MSYYHGLRGLALRPAIKRPLFLHIGLRYSGAFGANKFASFVSIMSAIGVCIGVCALIVVSSVMNGLEDNMKNRVLAVVPHAVVAEKSADAGGQTENAEFAELLEGIDGVRSAAKFAQSQVIIQSHKRIAAVSAYGVDAADYPENDLIRSSMGATRETDRMHLLEKVPFSIILGAGLAHDLDVIPGDSVRVIFPRGARHTPMGRIPAQRLFRVVGTFMVGNDVDSTSALVNLKDFAAVSRMGKKFDGYRVWLDDPFEVDGFIGNLKKSGSDAAVTDWRVEKGELFKAVATEKRMMTLMLFLIIFVAAFNILSSLIMMVMDKTGEIAVLRTIGFKRRDVMGAFMVQGMAACAVGTFFGAAIGLPAAIWFNEITAALGLSGTLVYANLPVLVDPVYVAAIIVCSLALSCLATLYPSYKAAGVMPAEALRYE